MAQTSKGRDDQVPRPQNTELDRNTKRRKIIRRRVESTIPRKLDIWLDSSQIIKKWTEILIGWNILCDSSQNTKIDRNTKRWNTIRRKVESTIPRKWDILLDSSQIIKKWTEILIGGTLIGGKWKVLFHGNETFDAFRHKMDRNTNRRKVESTIPRKWDKNQMNEMTKSPRKWQMNDGHAKNSTRGNVADDQNENNQLRLAARGQRHFAKNGHGERTPIDRRITGDIRNLFQASLSGRNRSARPSLSWQSVGCAAQAAPLAPKRRKNQLIYLKRRPVKATLPHRPIFKLWCCTNYNSCSAFKLNRSITNWPSLTQTSGAAH
jgi:hypothetical protein